MTDTTVYVAKESGSADIGGKTFIFIKGVTRVRAGHPILRQIGQFFEPAEEHVHYDVPQPTPKLPEVEQATKAPGEKRGEPKPK